jgi:hypothetical protein
MDELDESMGCNPLTTEANHGRQSSYEGRIAPRYQIPEENVQRFLAVGCLPMNKVARQKIIFRHAPSIPALAPIPISKFTKFCPK